MLGFIVGSLRYLQIFVVTFTYTSRTQFKEKPVEKKANASGLSKPNDVVEKSSSDDSDDEDALNFEVEDNDITQDNACEYHVRRVNIRKTIQKQKRPLSIIECDDDSLDEDLFSDLD